MRCIIIYYIFSSHVYHTLCLNHGNKYDITTYMCIHHCSITNSILIKKKNNLGTINFTIEVMILLGLSSLIRKKIWLFVNIFTAIFFHYVTENYYSNSKYLIDMDKACLNTNTFRQKQAFVKRNVYYKYFLSYILTTFS